VVEEIITYVEMTAPDELRAARPVPAVALERIDRTSPLIRQTQIAIGTPHGWRSASRSDEE
jgi:hypothetical protein